MIFFSIVDEHDVHVQHVIEALERLINSKPSINTTKFAFYKKEISVKLPSMSVTKFSILLNPSPQTINTYFTLSRR